ncbi:MAG TPA: AAA family ATPase, partial [Solirubrobacteraceae bacterium]
MATETGTALLERDFEELEIAAALEDARAGRGRLVVVQAPGGLGKTTLLAQARSRAREAGVRVLAGRGSELESGFAFGIVRQLFERTLYDAPPEQRDAWLAGAADLARPMFDHTGVLDDAGDDFPRLHGLYWLCANVSRDCPLLIAVDDAHWSDEPSLKFLSFLVRRLEDLPILVLLGTRPSDEALSDLLPALAADPSARLLRPAPLSDDAVVRWVREATGDAAEPAFCDACHAATGGNPLLMSELLREVAAEGIAPTAGEADRVATLGPRGISTVVLLRLARLPQGAVDLARAVAVLGDSANLETAGTLAGLDAEAVNPTASSLIRAQVLVSGEGLSFVHPIVRAAIYEDIPVLDRAELHARAARLLSERDCTPEEVAAQVMESSPAAQEWVVGVLREAARRALVL